MPSAIPERPAQQLQPTLLAVAAAARVRLSASNERFLAGFDPASRAILARALRTSEADRRTWPQLITGSVQIRHQSTEVGETLWYNPLFDAGLAVQWRRVGSNWTVTRAWSVTGQNMRPAAASPPLLVGDIDRSAVSTQFVAAAQDLSRFTADGWTVPTPPSNATGDVGARVRAADAALAAMRQAPGYARAVIAAYELLSFSGPETEGIRPALKRAIAGLDPDTRLTLRAVTAFRIGTDWTLVMQSPVMPGVALFVSFERKNDAPVQIASASMSSYAEQEVLR
ncbi:hypothetical protein U1839_23040 [Sphingomonas sp. RT2P30]|uniref:hypothetical protein n=1 Tax=Parasphingomonas halimpatiens TaxID=3096162 RepID=UPI002FC75F31